jgi:hypothetical protein
MIFPLESRKPPDWTVSSKGSSTSVESGYQTRSLSSRRGFVDLCRCNEQKANAIQDQQDVESYASHRYQPGYDEDLTALRFNHEARMPIYDPRTDMAALPQSMAQPSMQPPYENLFAPVASNRTLPSNAPLMQQAPPLRAPQQTFFPTDQASQEPAQIASV